MKFSFDILTNRGFSLPVCLLTIGYWWLLPVSIAQKPGPPVNGANIVPNPGFEQFIGKPERWFYRGEDFKKGPRYWFSATTASPDAYAPHIKVPRDWAEKGFGKQKTHTGKGMAGITVYGCTNGKPHCREYIQVQLAEPLVIGQHYYLEFWTAPLKNGLLINNLGAYFSVKPIERTTDEILVRDIPVRAETVLEPGPKGGWSKVSGTFQARYEAEHLILGNFADDEHTLFQTVSDSGYNYAYYYIDDVILKKIPPYLPTPVPADDLSRIKPEKGKTYLLKNIYFEFDRYELMPRSYVELHKLLGILQSNPKISIEIIGHTDNIGSDTYNDELSVKRAQSVVRYLQQNGISSARLKFRGEGERQPVSDNNTEEGRAKNRRVEFRVL